MQQVRDGFLSEALITLDAVLIELEPHAATRPREWTDALVHKGWALVLLGQDERARQTFQKTLAYDSSLALSPDTFPSRVVRVFESARRRSKGGWRSGWDPVKIAFFGAVATGGALLAIQHAERYEPFSYALYYGEYVPVRFELVSPGSGCPAEGTTAFVLVGDVSGANFVVSFQQPLAGPGFPSGSGTIGRTGSFNISARTSGALSMHGRTDGTRLTAQARVADCTYALEAPKRR